MCERRNSQQFEKLMKKLGYRDAGMGSYYKHADRRWDEMLRLYHAGFRFPQIAEKTGCAPWVVAKMFHEHQIWPSYLVRE